MRPIHSIITPLHLLPLTPMLALLVAGCVGPPGESSEGEATESVAEGAAAAIGKGRKGMTWRWLSRTSDVDHVGSDGQTNPYQGDTTCNTSLPVLCIHAVEAAKPPYVTSTFYDGWSGGYVTVTSNRVGSELTSQAQGDAICADELGDGWAMAEFHDGAFGYDGEGGWGFSAYGAVPETGRFWTAIDDQQANCWVSPPVCAPGFADCDGEPSNGCETDLSRPASCGACGNVCGSGACGTSIAAGMATPPSDWSFNGTAFHEGSSHSAVLTRMLHGEAGTIVYGAPIKTDELTVSFEFRIDGDIQAGADGLAFLLATGDPTKVGWSGHGIGVQGLQGYATALNLFNAGNGHAGVWQLLGNTTVVLTPDDNSANVPFPTRNTGWHTETVQLSNGRITVKFDGSTVVSSLPLPGFVSGTPYYYGFGGGTGWLMDRHAIRNVSITFPSPRCLAGNGISADE